MTKVRYVTGDATQPQGDGVRFIAHVCNDVGGWGRGFVVALSKRDETPELFYRRWHAERSYLRDGEAIPFALGQIRMTPFNTGQVVYGGPESPVYVANMIAQEGIRHSSSAPPAINYKALSSCLDELGQEATRWWRTSGNVPTIHMPRIGCGLGGGDWLKVEKCIQKCLVDVYGLTVTVYDLPDSAA